MPDIDRNGLEVLDRDACVGLLSAATFGRLAYTDHGVIVVVPVNITPDGDRVLFRLGTGGLLAAITDRQLLTLEVDAVDAESCCGWSVNVVGTPREIPGLPAADTPPPVRSWLRAETTRLFGLRLDHVTGRRLLLTSHRPARRR